jgi:coenzyme F420-reducing hydrogenase delta subunit
VSNQEIREQFYFTEQVNGAPRLVTFICDWCLRADADVHVLESYPDNVRVIHIPCSGRIDPEMALLALKSRIDGVLVCGCQPGECHYQRGTLVSACKIGLLDRIFDQVGIEGGRVRFVQIGTTDRGRIREEIDTMLDHLTALKEAH